LAGWAGPGRDLAGLQGAGGGAAGGEGAAAGLQAAARGARSLEQCRGRPRGHPGSLCSRVRAGLPPAAEGGVLAPEAPAEAATLDGRCVLGALVCCLVVTVLTPPGRWGRLAGEGLFVALLLVLLRTPPRWLAGRLALLAPFLLLAGLSVPFLHSA